MLVMPSGLRMRWPDIIPPKAVPHHAASICFRSMPASDRACSTAGQAMSARVFSGYFPNRIIPVPMTRTSRMNVIRSHVGRAKGEGQHLLLFRILDRRSNLQRDRHVDPKRFGRAIDVTEDT